ncbi:MAG TPA: RHS repeat-associated core domain-containing protein, partial [Tepidisphaeraceae bacterium]|nr:RHS repeat-associated core domain-containing protein [Tepidisphaeraceae bacterium]
EYQAHSGAVVAATTPQTQYVYLQPTGANYSRLSAMIYPNARELDYKYTTTLDGAISRIDQLYDATGSYIGSDQTYTYLGLNTIVQAADGNGVSLSYVRQPNDTLASSAGGDQYTGLDEFGRVIDQNWVNTTTGVSTDRFQYGYDRNSNVLYKNNLLNGTFSELYHSNSTAAGDNNSAYDPLNRLTYFSRGTLSASGNNGAGGLDTVASPTGSNSWNYDAVGNITSSASYGSRTLNAQNQLQSAGGHSADYTPTGDLVDDPEGNRTFYDAWNRAVWVSPPAGGQVFFRYDALGRMIFDGSNNPPVDLYYGHIPAQGAAGSSSVIEERDANTGQVLTQTVWGLMYVNQMVLQDAGGRVYVQQDANWNKTAVVSTTGVVTVRVVYDPYGAATQLSPTWGSPTTFTTPSFQGGRWLPVGSGFYYFGSSGLGRLYDPTLGVWKQPEPFGARYVDGSNLYQFAQDKPVDGTDPTGLSYGWAWLAPGAWWFYQMPVDLFGYTPPSDDVATGDDILKEYFNGIGPQDRYFGPNAFMTSVIKDAAAVNDARKQANDQLAKEMCKPCDQRPSTLPSIPILQDHTDPLWDIPRMMWNRWSGGRGGNMGFVGGYVGKITFEKKGCDYVMHFTINNTTSRASGSAGPANRPVRQHWFWDETYEGGPNIRAKQ